MSPPLPLEPAILLLVPHDLQTYALAVGDILLSRFQLRHVLVRSTQTPADRLLLLKEQQPTLFVVLGPATASTSIVETESAAPIITLPSNDVATTALAIAKCCSLASTELQKRVQQVVLENRQARLVQDAQLRTSSPLYTNTLAVCFDQKRQVTGDSLASTQRGKVRDRFELPNGQLALVTTDRQSGFDRMLALVPFKGAVLNLTSAFWFEKTAHIIPNHLVAVPHPYMSICRKCTPFPIEFVVRYVPFVPYGGVILDDFSFVSDHFF